MKSSATKTVFGLLMILVIIGGALFFLLPNPSSITQEAQTAEQASEADMAQQASTDTPTEAPTKAPPPTQAPPATPIESAQPMPTTAAAEDIASSDTQTHQGEPNRLIDEKSPYLLQHAYNPVDWYPWGPEAFEKARQENKPIFLSIGYSTCHWCHVMERESFEDEEVGRAMNDSFVSIKVDREERPDIDNIYMEVSIMMTGGGGWPLNIIMTPDQKPFFAATYIPKETRFEQLGMVELSARVKEIWSSQNQELVDIGEQVLSALEQSSRNVPGQELGQSTLNLAYQQLASRFDAQHGGFAQQPKFPSPHQLLFLLRHWERTSDQQALAMVEHTLQEMRKGGIYDHLGFGFHRYATDAEWRIPHFEKMLYDQAMLAMAYTEAYQATGKEEYAQTVREIFIYILRDMTDPMGGFYSAEDADSEGEEGKFYLWTEAEIREILAPEEADLIVQTYNLLSEGNFADEVTGEINGKNIFYLTNSLSEMAAAQQLSAEEITRLEEARQKLFGAREGRIHPYKDKKILTDWNGLMIAAFAKASQALNEPAYAEAATQAADFILTSMRDKNGRLLHIYYENGEAGLTAHLDDYAFFVWGLLELYESTFELRYLQEALTLTEDMRLHFWDEQAGAFYFTPDDGEALLVRQKEIDDGAIPSGNSVAMSNLLRIGRITANTDYENEAAMVGNAFAGQIGPAPSAFTHLMTALNFGVGPSYEIVIVGEPEAADTQAMLAALRGEFIPNKVLLLRPPGDAPELTKIAEFTEYQFALNDQATAYVCLNYYCELPTNDVNQMLELLGKKVD